MRGSEDRTLGAVTLPAVWGIGEAAMLEAAGSAGHHTALALPPPRRWLEALDCPVGRSTGRHRSGPAQSFGSRVSVPDFAI